MGRSQSAASLLLAALVAACGSNPPAGSPGAPAAASQPITISGFNGPEAVRYDPQQDVYFVGNWNGPAGALDNNGSISRVRPDGSVERLDFIAGGANGVTLHAPRGMWIAGDTLWAADVDAVRGFHRRTGAPVATVDFTALQPGFLNDVARGPDGALYVTDTPKDRIYRIAGRTPSIALQDTALGRPNGITWDAAAGRFVVAPYGGKNVLLGWHPDRPGLEVIARSTGGGYDGVEVLGRGVIVASSQADSSLHLFVNGQGRPFARTPGRPADIAVDTRRRRVAVPYIALNRVDLFALPSDAR